MARKELRDLSRLSEQEAEKYISSLGAFGYDTTVLMNEYKRTKKITI